LKFNFPDLLVEIRVVESSPEVESVHGMADSYLAVDDASAHGAEHLAKFGLRPYRSESAGACADDCDRLVADGVRRYRP
jgi:hypothetical protein